VISFLLDFPNILRAVLFSPFMFMYFMEDFFFVDWFHGSALYGDL
jgi:hypothetical protein